MSGFPLAYVVIPNVKLGDCFVARVFAAGNWASADSNKICVDANVKFGTETAGFAPVNSYGSFSLQNLEADCAKDYLAVSGVTPAGSVGWQPTPSTIPCPGTQILRSGFTFDVGGTQFPIAKAELLASGMSCVGELDFGPSGIGSFGSPLGLKYWTKMTFPQLSGFDRDVTTMFPGPPTLTYVIPGVKQQVSFVFAPTPPSFPGVGHCISGVSGVTLKVTRLR